jgi:hypothetical protein
MKIQSLKHRYFCPWSHVHGGGDPAQLAQLHHLCATPPFNDRYAQLKGMGSRALKTFNFS